MMSKELMLEVLLDITTFVEESQANSVRSDLCTSFVLEYIEKLKVVDEDERTEQLK